MDASTQFKRRRWSPTGELRVARGTLGDVVCVSRDVAAAYTKEEEGQTQAVEHNDLGNGRR